MPHVPLDADVIAFLLGRRSIIVGSADASRRPTLMRAVGARLSAGASEVTILLARSQAAELLACVRACGRVAAVFSEPTTHRTLQLKGSDARVEDALAADLAVLEPYADQLVAELGTIGFDASLVRAMIAADPQDVVALRFTPEEIFDQTPGPHAGAAVAG